MDVMSEPWDGDQRERFATTIKVVPMDADWYDGWFVEHAREDWRARGQRGLDTFWVAPRSEQEAHEIAAWIMTAKELDERTLYEQAMEMAGGARRAS